MNTDSEALPDLSFSQFRAMSGATCAGHSDENSTPGAFSQARALVLLVGQKRPPMWSVVTAVQTKKLTLEFSERLDVGMQFCIRLPMGEREAAWVQYEVASWSPLISGRCEVTARYARTCCPHAINCPAFVFIREGRRVACSHAGHAGCLQTGPTGPTIRQLLT